MDRERSAGARRAARLAFEEAMMDYDEEDYDEEGESDDEGDEDDDEDEEEDDNSDGDGDGGMELGAALEDMLVGSEGSGASDDMDDSSGEQSDDEEEDDDDVSASSGDLQGPDGADVAFDHAEEAMEGGSDLDPSDDDGFDEDEGDDGFGDEFDDEDEEGDDMDEEYDDDEDGGEGPAGEWDYEEDEEEEFDDGDDWAEGDRDGPRIRLFPPTNAHHLQQLLDEIVVGMGGRESADRRRYRIISRRDIANGGNASGQPGAQAADSTAHTLLTRPAGGVQRLSMRGVDVQFGLPGGGGVPLDRSMAEGIVSQLMADFPGQLRRLVLDPVNAGPWPYGGGGGASRGGRPDSRANPWGLPVNDSSLGTGTTREGGALASTMEDVVLGALQEGAPPAATPAPPPPPLVAQQAAPSAGEPPSRATPARPRAREQQDAQAQAPAAEPSAPHPSHEPSQLPTPQPTSLGLAATDIMQALEAALAAATGTQPAVPAQAAAPPDSMPDAEMGEAAAGSAEPMQQGTNGGEDKDDAPEAAAPAQPSPDPAAAAGSSGAAIDNSFLEALPTGLRDEVMAAPADAEAPGGSAGPVEEDDAMDSIDPEFLAALPPDIQAEVLEQQRQQRRRARLAAAAATAAAAAPAPEPTAGSEMDVASVLATFPPDLREEILLTDESVLATLPPALLAEAQALRDRSMRAMRMPVRPPPMQAPVAAEIRSIFQRQPQAPAGFARRSAAAVQNAAALRTAPGRATAPMPQLDEASLLLLLQLLRVNSPATKSLLQRLLANLVSYAPLNAAIVRILLASLRGPLTFDEGGSEGAVPLIGIKGESSVVGVAIARRVLDLLANLAKTDTRTALSLVTLPVPMPSTLHTHIAQQASRATKGKAKADDPAAGAGTVTTPLSELPASLPAVQVLLGMLGRPFCRRSALHLEWVLTLLDAGLAAAVTRVKELVRKEQAAAKEAGVEGAAPDGANASAATTGMSSASVYGCISATTNRTAPMDVGEGGSSPPQPPTPTDAPDSLPDPRPALSAVPSDMLRLLPSLHSTQRLSDGTQKKCASLLRSFCMVLPHQQAYMLTVLADEAVRLGREAARDIAVKVQAGSPLTTSATQTMCVMLALCTLTGLQSDQSQPLAPPSQDEQAATATNLTVLDRVSNDLEPLWQALSLEASSIEAEIKANVPDRTAMPSTTVRMLPQRALPVLPLLEAFFLLCDARMGQQAMLAAASAPEEAAEAATPTRARSTSVEPVGPSSVLATAPSKNAVLAHEGQLPFLRFAEQHRRLLNAYVRHTPSLLEASLRLLLKAPRLIDFDNKRSHFRGRIRASHDDRHYGSLRISVRREHVFEDSFHQLRLRSPEEMRAKLNVTFAREEGIDAGGVTREWYQVMAREIFNPNFSLFVAVPEAGTTFQPNPNSVVQNDEVRGTNHLDFFRFVGRIVGKALYDGQLIDAHFTRSFYKHMLGQQLTYEDIEAVDPEFYKNLIWMLENDITHVLDLNFTEEVDYFGRTETVELKPGGAGIKVTEGNKREYVNLVARHRMTTAIKAQIGAFLEGFWELVPKTLVSVFNDHELELLISGLPEIDVDDLRANTEYSGFTAGSPVMQWFWEVVREMDAEQLALLVQFVTGTSKVPLEGFKALQGVSGPQKFQIHKAYGPANRLPSAHTCFNQLDLIEYETKEQLRERLLLALQEGSEGFGFG